MQAEIRRAPFCPGDVLADKYRVDHWLGDGGMGVVLCATDIFLQRRVAIKFLWPEYAKQPEAAERFTREARVGAKLHSEHVTRVIEIGSLPDGSLFIVMEHLQGSDLSYVCRQPGGVSPTEAVYYVVQASDAIAEAHARGIIHRDLKPANLFLALQPDGSSKVKVLDFGVSKQTAPDEPSALALTGKALSVGSPLYMSPEQMRASPHVDARTDIWGLGVILYELLSGTLPFEARTAAELSAKVLGEAPTPLLERAPHVSSELAQIVHRCLSKEPGERYQSVAELVLALEPHAPLKARGQIERCLRVLNCGQELETFAKQTLPLGMLNLPPSRPRFVSAPDQGLVTGLETTQGFKLSRGRKAMLWWGLGVVVILVGAGRLLVAHFDVASAQERPLASHDPSSAAFAVEHANRVPAGVRSVEAAAAPLAARAPQPSGSSSISQGRARIPTSPKASRVMPATPHTTEPLRERFGGRK